MSRVIGLLILLLCLPSVAFAVGSGVVETGSLTTNGDALTVTTLGASNVAVQVAGTWTGTLQFEGTVDGSTWFSVEGIPFSIAAAASSTTASGQWMFAAPLKQIRVRSSAAMTGTATVAVLVTPAGPGTSALQSTIDGANAAVKVTGVTVFSTQGYNRTASGALGALNNAVTLDATGSGGIAYEIDTGSLSGTVVSECTLDDSNWFSVYMVDLDGKTFSRHTSFGVRGQFKNVGFSQCRLRVSAYTSGTSNARLAVSPGPTGIRPDSVSCMDSYAVTTASAATATAVAGVAGQRIYVCGWDVIAAGTTNVTLKYGDDANCASNPVALTGAYPLTAQAGRAGWASGGIVVRLPVAKFLCVTNSEAIQISGVISYANF